MIKCVNEKCNKDADNLYTVIVNEDGDMACCQSCADEYKKQMDYFLNVTVHSEKLTEDYLLGK